jgi:hypothetical protein
VSFGRSRESRSREAAGRRNWTEQCPGKCAAEKGEGTGMGQLVEGGEAIQDGQAATTMFPYVSTSQLNAGLFAIPSMEVIASLM